MGRSCRPAALAPYQPNRGLKAVLVRSIWLVIGVHAAAGHAVAAICHECAATEKNTSLWWVKTGLNCPHDNGDGSCDISVEANGASKSSVAYGLTVKTAEDCCSFCALWNLDKLPGGPRSEGNHELDFTCRSWYFLLKEDRGGSHCVLKNCEKHDCGAVSMSIDMTSGAGCLPHDAGEVAWGWPCIAVVLGAAAAYLLLGTVKHRATDGTFQPPHQQFWLELGTLIGDGVSYARDLIGFNDDGKRRYTQTRKSKRSKKKALLSGTPPKRRHKKSRKTPGAVAYIEDGGGGGVTSQRDAWDYYNEGA